MVSLLGECHEPGSEGTELMGNIAGARLVAQTVRGGSAVRARSERDQSAAETRPQGAEWMEKNCRGGGAPAII